MNRTLLALALFFSVGISSAQTSSTGASCVAYGPIIVPGSGVPCTSGAGMMYKWKTVTCPGSVETTTPTPLATTCVSATPTSGSAQNCTGTNQGAGCATQSTANGCPSGQEWITTGSTQYIANGVSHCEPIVQNCNATPADGSQINCSAVPGEPSNAVGVAHYYVYTTYNGSTNCTQQLTGSFDTSACSVPAPPTPPVTPACNTGIANGGTLTCPAAGLPGDSGTAYYRVYTQYTGGGSCIQTAAPGYNTTGCTATALPTCNTGVANGVSKTCPAAGLPNDSGTAYAQVYTQYTGGGSCTQTAAPGYNTSGCTANPPSCSASTSVTHPACGRGYTGTETVTVTTSCPSGPYGTASTSTTTDKTQCAELTCVLPQVLNAAGTACITPITCTLPWGSTIAAGSSTTGFHILPINSSALVCNDAEWQEGAEYSFSCSATGTLTQTQTNLCSADPCLHLQGCTGRSF